MKKIITYTMLFLFTCNAFAWQVNKRIQVEEYLDKLELNNKTLVFDVGIGSGAYHFKGDKKNVFYTITDRGVNIKCKDSKKVIGKEVCKKGKIFPVPNFAPTIYKISLHKNWYKVLEKIQIKDRDGIPLSGISNKGTEKAFDIKGKEIAYDSHGIDAEALVKLSDGTFWIAEEYGASILHIAQDGRVLKRVVPSGFENNIQDANYNISPTLPAIIQKRKLNRGIESLGVSLDEKYLYFSMQSPLANPSKKAYSNSKNVRIFKYDIKDDKTVGEYVYQIDSANSFKLDNANKQSSVKISELVVSADDELIILERVSKTTKFYKVKLENSILNSKWDDINTSPSLEENSEYKDYMKKELVLDTSNLNGMPTKVEGIAYIDENHWILVNDNDFSIKNDKTFLIEIKR